MTDIWENQEITFSCRGCTGTCCTGVGSDPCDCAYDEDEDEDENEEGDAYAAHQAGSAPSDVDEGDDE